MRYPEEDHPNCPHASKLSRAIFANGSVHVAYVCERCWYQSQWLDQKELRALGVNIDELPLWCDYRATRPSNPNQLGLGL